MCNIVYMYAYVYVDVYVGNLSFYPLYNYLKKIYTEGKSLRKRYNDQKGD